MDFLEYMKPIFVGVATATVPSAAGYLAVDQHAQLMKEKEHDLNVRSFEAEQLSTYLALPHKDVLTKRAMATYLQASLYDSGRGNSKLHGWVTREIDIIKADTQRRRKLLDEKRAELNHAKKQRDALVARRTELDTRLLNPNQTKEERSATEANLKRVDKQLQAANERVLTLRAEFDEETQQTLEVSGPTISLPGVCTVKHEDGRPQQTLYLSVAACRDYCVSKDCSSSFVPVGIGIGGGSIGIIPRGSKDKTR